MGLFELYWYQPHVFEMEALHISLKISSDFIAISRIDKHLECKHSLQG